MTKDTHGQQGEGWIGFDLDGTLAKYDGWKGIDHIGEPIEPMVSLIRVLHAEGKTVKILTARVAPRPDVETKPNPYLVNHRCIEAPDDMPWAIRIGTWTALEFIQDWCYRFLGFVPEITHEKDHLMIDLYDDRCHQVVPNTGEVVEDELRRARLACRMMADGAVLDLRTTSKVLFFFLGCLTSLVLLGLIGGWFRASVLDEKERKLHEAIHEYIGEKIHAAADATARRALAF